MFRSAIRFSYATLLGLVFLALGLALALDVIAEADGVSEALPEMLIPAVLATIGLVILALQPRGGWLIGVGLVLILPFTMAAFLLPLEYADEPASSPLYGLHGLMVLLLDLTAWASWGALVVGYRAGGDVGACGKAPAVSVDHRGRQARPGHRPSGAGTPCSGHVKEP